MKSYHSQNAIAWSLGIAIGSQLVLGCSSPGEKGPGSAPSTTSTFTSAGMSISDPLPDLRLPIQDYIESDQLRHNTAIAITKIATECLDRGGVKYRPPLSRYEPPPSPMAGRYGPVNDDQAAFGYHFMTALPKSTMKANTPPPARDAKTVTDCFDAAHRSIPQAGNPELTDKIKDTAYFQAENMPAVKESFAKWSACMKESGYSYSSPQAAMRDDHWNWKSDQPSHDEILVAMRDVLCKEKSGVVKAWFDGEVTLEKRGIAENASELAPIRNGLKQQERRVNQVVATTTP